eukprot:3283092-Pyramimonas_sp.AAC.1
MQSPPLMPRSRLSASHVAVCWQGIYVEYPVEYSKCCALNGILVSTVDSRIEVEGLFGRRLRGLHPLRGPGAHERNYPKPTPNL